MPRVAAPALRTVSMIAPLSARSSYCGQRSLLLEEQAHRLARHLGRLRPYIYHFIGAAVWVMHVPAVPGATWNALGVAGDQNFFLTTFFLGVTTIWGGGGYGGIDFPGTLPRP